MLGYLDALRPSRHSGVNAFEYRVFSQHREDGILAHLLDTIGRGTDSFIEFGFAPSQCNCLCLALRRQFSGLFIDAAQTKCHQASLGFQRLGLDRVQVRNAFIDLDNLNSLIRQSGWLGTIDVLSVDVDGNDYWFWQALDAVSPRIVVIEYNASLGPDRSLTVPYDPRFDRYQKHPSGYYHGASLLALERLGRRKGYRLVASDSTGVNAFFLRQDMHAPDIAGLSAQQAYFPHRGRTRYRGDSLTQQFARIQDMPFETID